MPVRLAAPPGPLPERSDCADALLVAGEAWQRGEREALQERCGTARGPDAAASRPVVLGGRRSGLAAGLLAVVAASTDAAS